MLRATRRTAVRAAALLTLAVAVCAIAGCDPFGSTGAKGTVSLQITDGPFPFDLIEKATVTITRIEIRQADPAEVEEDQAEDAESEPADEEATDPTASQRVAASETDDPADTEPEDGDDTEELEDEDEGDDSPWVVIYEGEKAFNLLDLRNGRTDLLASIDVPAGTYTQMRLIVTEGTVTLKDGREFNLKIPSGAQSGIKLHFTFTVEEGENQPLLLDVDLSKAFKPIPGSAAIKEAKDIKGFKFQPSLAMRLINIVQAGSISGTVTDAALAPLAGVTVTVLRDGEEVASTSTEADGTYALVGLPAGAYKVLFAAEGYTGVESEELTVAAGQETAGVNAALEPVVVEEAP